MYRQRTTHHHYYHPLHSAAQIITKRSGETAVPRNTDLLMVVYVDSGRARGAHIDVSDRHRQLPSGGDDEAAASSFTSPSTSTISHLSLATENFR